MAETDVLKISASVAVDAAIDGLKGISDALWSNPELGYQENEAHDLLANYLEDQGFSVDRKYLLDTAFRATVGIGSPHVTVICEYDALPGIGHACGHNLIAEVGVAAGLGIKAAMEAAGKPLGKLSVIGTPAEEGGGGKIVLANAGAFDDVDLALMAHPFNVNISRPNVSAACMVKITFNGKASHAAAAPWDGVNALDAAVMTYSAVSCMRQQMKPTSRIHGVISNGGEKPNIIPEKSELLYIMRGRVQSEYTVLRDKLVGCVEAAAKATGCTVEYEWMANPYQNMINNEILCNLYEKNAAEHGLNLEKIVENGPAFSTDMGNLSHLIPSIHPIFNIGTEVPPHTRGFATAAGDPKAQPYTLTQGKLLAMVAVDVLCNPGLVDTMKAQLQEALEKGE